MSQPRFHGTQLQPETILHAVSDTEERLWVQGGITDEREESLHHNPGEMGSVILQHATCTRKIHGHFSNLEQRKCCLMLAACKQKFSSVRLVRNDGRDSGIEEGAMMKSAMGSTDTVCALNAQEFQVFQRALRCAAFPVLGAPDPPTGATPSPVVCLPHHRSEVLTLNRSMTPHSLHDSGVEDQEDTSMVPAETLCELLRRAFRLSPEKFSQYEDLIAGQLERKSPQKLLAEELVRQLVALENNANPFYNPKTFLNRHGYDQWQQRERTHITDLIHKFWHFSLPQPSSSSTMSHDAPTRQLHEDYRLLMETLIRYESPYRQESELVAPQPTSPLSSASHRLLQEFGLRYGVGDQYRKIVYLTYLALNFDPTVWFIEHTMTSLTNVMESMPSKRSFLAIVKEEFSMLEKSLLLLEAKTSAALGKMKTLFPSDTHVDGIESLIELLSITLQGKSYLLMHAEEPLGIKLQKIVQTIFPTAYERHKMVAEDELRQNKWEVELNPKLLNMLIGNIRDEIQDYRQNYQLCFIKYFNVTVEASQELYGLLMADVAQLHRETQDELRSLEINLLMLSLAYRLNQLDQDWATYITPQMQTWRSLFLCQAQHWSVVMKVHMQDIVTHSVSLDKYTTCQLEWSGSLHESSSIVTSPGNRTMSKSLTPSVNSAFSSLSSPYSTPALKPMPGPISHPQPVPEVSTEQERASDPPLKSQLSPEITSVSYDPKLFTEKRPNSDPVNISRSSMLSGSYLGDMAMSLGHYDEDTLFLSFAHMRHSSSLPNILPHHGQRYIEMENRATITKTEKSRPVETKPKKQTQQAPRRLDSNEGMASQEVSDFLENPVNTSDNESESEGSSASQTLTDDSDSQAEDYKYPPLEEVNIVSSSPSCNAECKPVTMAGNLDQHTSVVRPTTRNVGSAVLPQKQTSVPKQKSITSTTSKNLQDSQNQWLHTTDSANTDDKYKTADANVFDSLTNSLNSNMSYSLPATSSAAILSISSSAIDVAVILQRLVGIGSTLCQTLLAGKWNPGSDPSILQSSEDDAVFMLPQNASCRQKLYDSFLDAICNTICQYADNMLCMDLCGNPSATACRLAGPRLVEYLQTQQKSGLVWGCRHNITGTKNCFAYLNRRTDLLCDRHEPITLDMCTRINNVLAMLSYLDWYHHRLGNVFCVFSDWSIKQKHLTTSINSTEILRSEFIVLENYGYNPDVDRGDVMETVSQLCPSESSGPKSTPPVMVSSPVDPYRNHLMAILRAQCRLMAYRLNLFVADALPVLLTLKGHSVSLEAGLKPITDFLSEYIAALGAWLYKDNFRRVLECLWIFVVQDFETELETLEGTDDGTEKRSQLLLQALSHLLRFMNEQHACLRKDLLLSQAESVSFRLSLHAMPVCQLIAIYRGLITDHVKTEVSSTDTQYQTVLLVRQRLQHDLQLLHKGFSGLQLVHWIVCNQELFLDFDPVLAESSMPFSMETAYHVAQRLLDWKLIADVEGETGAGADRSRSNSFVYPNMTMVSQFLGQDRPNRTSSHGSDDSTPQATPITTPRATPRPNLKASLRASSRLSGFKSATPAGKFVDKQHSNRPQQKWDRSDKDLRQSVLIKPSPVVVNVEVHKKPTETLVESIEEVDSPSDHGHGPAVCMAGTQVELQAAAGAMETGNQLLNTADVTDNLIGQKTSCDVTGNMHSLDSLDSSLELGFNNNNAQGREMGYASENSDPYLHRGTSMSLTSGISCESSGLVFIHSPDTFYYVCPLVGHETETSLNNYELFHLVEQCFQKKVSADYIMRIIYSRRRHSDLAKNFVRATPGHVINYMKHLYDTDDSTPTCVSS